MNFSAKNPPPSQSPDPLCPNKSMINVNTIHGLSDLEITILDELIGKTLCNVYSLKSNL